MDLRHQNNRLLLGCDGKNTCIATSASLHSYTENKFLKSHLASALYNKELAFQRPSPDDGFQQKHSLKSSLCLSSSNFRSTLQNRCLTDKPLYSNFSDPRLNNSLLEKNSIKKLKTENDDKLIFFKPGTGNAPNLSSPLILSSPSISTTNYEPLAKRVKVITKKELVAEKTRSERSRNKHSFPKYSFEQLVPVDGKEINFQSPCDENQDLKHRKKQLQNQSKTSLINAVCISLIRGPNLKNPKDAQRLLLIQYGKIISEFDPEFILKVALYARQELNIRTTANLLLAFAAFDPKCRPFLKRYFNKSVVLPSDWLDIAEQYQYFDDKNINFGSLPSALRKVLTDKFKNFSVYQLAKYNKTKSKKEKSKKDEDLEAVKKIMSDESEENEEELERRTFTLKRLIRMLHIGEPAEYVMGLVGKRYPENAEKFRESRLEGIWDQSKSGKRMKLPTPITWETQLSAHGNRRETWEDLITKRNLPYMAMLRNLRNIMLAGVSMKHHDIVLKTISDKNCIIRSRQFPHQFAAAEDAVKELQLTMFPRDAGKAVTSREVFVAQRRENKTSDQLRKVRLMRKALAGKERCNEQLFNRYYNALKRAMNTATFYNISPIHGRTLILLDMTDYMNVCCKTAKGLGKPRTVLDMAKLLSNVCFNACEMGTVLEFCTKGTSEDGASCNETKLITNIDKNLFTQVIRDQQKIDNVIVFTSLTEIDVISHFVSKCRLCVNQNLLYVTVCLASTVVRASAEKHEENDVRLVGFTDGILRFIAERGKGGQLGFVERIDEKYGLDSVPRKVLSQAGDCIVQVPPGVENIIPSTLQTVKVFISSTFRDMNSERDILIKYIFPELRSRARSLNIDVREVDLRWGITEAESNNDKLLEICLTEITKCQLFIGILGERYGYVPKSYDISASNPNLMWLQEYPAGASLTELEFYLAALAHPNEAKERAFFYIRNDSVYGDIPKLHIKEFVDESVENRQKLNKLKTRLCASGLEVYNGYPCSVGENISGKTIVINLHEFGQRVLDNLWTALQKISIKPEGYNEHLKESSLHASFVAEKNNRFVGRKDLATRCIETILSAKQGLIIIHGKQGSGKTALMAHLIHELDEKIKQRYPVIFFFVGASTMSGFALSIMRYLAEQISTKTSLDYEFSPELSNSYEDFQQVLMQASKMVERLLIFVDGLDALKKEQQLKLLENLQKIPPGVTIVCTAVTNSQIYKRLILLPLVKILPIRPMGLADKMQVIRKNLSTHSKVLDESSFNNQLNMLALKYESSLPLFISLACEELRTFGIFEKLSEKIQSLSSTLEGLLQNVFDRLEEDYSHKLIAGVLGFLTVCEDGLHEEDLHVLLSTYLTHFDEISSLDDAKKLGFSLNGITLPRVRFYQLLRSLHCLLQLTGHSCDRMLRLGFSNVVNAVRTRYRRGILSTSGELQLHYIIAAYFWKLAKPHDDDCWSASIPRGLSALPHHLLASGAHRELVELLSNLGFIQANVEAGIMEQLMEKYCSTEIFFNLSKSRAKGLHALTGLETVKQYERFLTKNMHVLKLVPQLTVQQAFNEPGDFIVSANAKTAVQNVYNNMPPLIAWVNKPQYPDSCVSTIKLTTPALCTSMSSDEKYIAFGEANTVHLYDVEANKKVTSFIGHGNRITSLLFIGCSKLCSADCDGTISIWNIEPNYRIHVLMKHTRRVSACCCDPAGLNLVAVGWDGAISLWNVNSGEELKFISPEKKWSPINCVAFHPVKQMVIAGSWDGTLKIWCLLSFQCKAIIHAHTASVCSVSISPDSKMILSTSLDCTLKMWSSRRGFQLACIKNSSTFTSASFTPSGSHVVTANADKTIKIYSASIGQKVALVKSARNIALTCLLLSSEMIVTGFEDGMVQSSNYSTGADERLIRCGDGAVTCLAWCKISKDVDHLRLLVGMQSGKLNLLKFQEFTVDKDLLGHTSAITSVAASLPTMIVSGSVNGCIAVHCISWKDNLDSVAASYLLHAHNGSVTSVSFQWNWKHFATTGDDQVLKTWLIASFIPKTSEIQPEPKLEIYGCNSGSVTACCWVKHANYASALLVTAGKDLTLCAWNSCDGTRVWIKRNFDAAITYLKCLQKHLLIGASLDGKIYAWSPSGMNLMEICGNGESYFSVFSEITYDNDNWYNMAMKEEKQLARNDKGPTVTQSLQSLADDLSKIFIARAGPVGDVNIIKPCLDNAKEVLVGHSDSVISIASGIREKLVSSSLDGTVKVWKPQCFLDTRQEMVSELRHTNDVACLTEGTTKDVMISGDRDGHIIIWHMDKNVVWRPVNKTKAHQKAITVLIALPHEPGLFISAANDGLLSIWKYEVVVPLKKPQQEISCLKEISDDELVSLWTLNLVASKNLSSSIISAVMHKQTKSLIVGSSSEILYEVDLKRSRHDHSWELILRKLNYSQFCQHTQIKPWTTHLKCITMNKSNEALLFSVNSLRTVALWKLNCDSSEESLFTDDIARMMGKPNVAMLNCHRDTWPTAVEIFNDSTENNDHAFKVLMGFASGELMAFSLKHEHNGEKYEASEIILKKFHAGAVNGVSLCSKLFNDEPYIFCTGGEDHVIRIWKVFPENVYKQISQFYCESPITCILSSRFENDDQKMNVTCGDALGHVYMLTTSL